MQGSFTCQIFMFEVLFTCLTCLLTSTFVSGDGTSKWCYKVVSTNIPFVTSVMALQFCEPCPYVCCVRDLLCVF